MRIMQRRMARRLGPNQCRAVFFSRKAYEDVVYYKKNIHAIPANKPEKDFLNFFCQTLNRVADQSMQKHYAWHLNMILPALMLQIKDPTATHRQRSKLLKEMLVTLAAGKINLLIQEVKVIQNAIGRRRKKTKPKQTNWITEARKKFQQGEGRAAIRELDEDNKGVESPTNETYIQLKSMFPPRRRSPVKLPEPDTTNTRYSHTTPSQIRVAIDSLQGSGGPSQMDAKSYKRILNLHTFEKEPKRMIETLAKITNSFTSERQIDNHTYPLKAVRMIALKKPEGRGLIPVGVGEVIRRVITKVVARCMKQDIKNETGSIQCSGLPGTCEGAYWALEKQYNEGKPILILDAYSAFNKLNRTSTLITASQRIPHAYTTYLNFYQEPTRAFHGGKEISVEEGTVQGCSLSSVFYDIGILPLVEEIRT